MAKLGENAPVYSLLPQIKNYQIPNHCDVPFDFRKGKTGIVLLPDHSLI